jgi:hypothetical protein
VLNKYYIMESKKQEIQQKIVFFLKFIISVMGDHIDDLPRCQKT